MREANAQRESAAHRRLGRERVLRHGQGMPAEYRHDRRSQLDAAGFAACDGQRGYGITQIYCSPMQRALHTAQYIGQALGLDPQVWVDVHERGGIFLDHGDNGGGVGYPGKTRSEILAEFPNYVLPETITEQGWWHQQGEENMAAFDERTARVAEVLRQWAASDEQIAIVSHGAFVDRLLKVLFNQSPGHDVFYFHLNTAISWIAFHSDGRRLDVEYINRVNHLPLELVS